MSDFINTIDLLGDEATLDGILTGDITEFNDNVITTIHGSAFAETKVERVNFPNATSVGGAFHRATKLKICDFGSRIGIANYSFYTVSSLKALILRSEEICELGGTNNFNKIVYFYVPKALVSSYQSAKNWSTFASQFRALEDYTVDGTITGELDESKI